MKVYSAKDKDAVLFEIVKSHPKNCIIGDSPNKEIAKGSLLPCGYIEILTEVGQVGGLIVCQATQKGIDFITKGGYIKENENEKKEKIYTKVRTYLWKSIIEICIFVIGSIILAFLVYYFGLKD